VKLVRAAFKGLALMVGNVLAWIVGLLVLGALLFGALWLVNRQEALEGNDHPLTESADEFAEEQMDPEEREKQALKEISDYCAYGAVSKSQLLHCYYNVRIEEVQERDTNAAKWARHELNECLVDSGPYCSTSYRDTIEKRIDSKNISAKLQEL
jgi:hypothetical protein